MDQELYVFVGEITTQILSKPRDNPQKIKKFKPTILSGTKGLDSNFVALGFVESSPTITTVSAAK